MVSNVNNNFNPEAKHAGPGPEEPIPGALLTRKIYKLDAGAEKVNPVTLYELQAKRAALSRDSLKQTTRRRISEEAALHGHADRITFINNADFVDANEWLAQYRVDIPKIARVRFIVNCMKGERVYETGWKKIQDAYSQYIKASRAAFSSYAQQFNAGESVSIQFLFPPVPKNILDDVDFVPEEDLKLSPEGQDPERLSGIQQTKPSAEIAASIAHIVESIGGLIAQAKFYRFCEKKNIILENLTNIKEVSDLINLFIRQGGLDGSPAYSNPNYETPVDNGNPANGASKSKKK